MQWTVTTCRKSFKNNVLRQTRTTRLSQTLPLGGGTVPCQNVLPNVTNTRRFRFHPSRSSRLSFKGGQNASGLGQLPPQSPDKNGNRRLQALPLPGGPGGPPCRKGRISVSCSADEWGRARASRAAVDARAKRASALVSTRDAARRSDRGARSEARGARALHISRLLLVARN
jgi:hypothetical protein